MDSTKHYECLSTGSNPVGTTTKTYLTEGYEESQAL